MAVNITKLRRLKSVKKKLKSKHNINMNFSYKFLSYIAAYSYTCKSVREVLHSENHLDNRDISSPKNKACMKVNKAKSSATQMSRELKRSPSSK